MGPEIRISRCFCKNGIHQSDRQRQCKSVAASVSGAENNSHRGMESQSAMVVLSEAPWGSFNADFKPRSPLRFLCQAREASWVRTRAKQSKHHSQMHGPKNSFK